MHVTIETRSPGDAAVDVLALPLGELDPAHWRLPPRVAALDRAAGGRIAQAVAAGDFKGKRGETLLVWTEGTGWNRGGSLAWQLFDRSGKPVGEAGSAPGIAVWSLAAAVAHPDGSFEIIY